MMDRANTYKHHESRLHAIANNQANTRLTFRKLTVKFDESLKRANTVVERRQTMKKNMESLESNIGATNNIKQKQAREYREFLLKKQLKKEGRPTWATNLCVDKPGWCCGISYIILLAITIVAFSLKYFDLNEPGYRDFLIWDNQRIIDWDMLEEAKTQML